MFRELRTILALFLCLSVLLSGCITANTAIFKPEPDSGGDWVIRVLGGFIDGSIASVISVNITLAATDLLEGGGTYGEWMAVYMGTLLVSWIGILLADTAIRSSLPYRKAYYQDKDAEEETTEADEEPSEESP